MNRPAVTAVRPSSSPSPRSDRLVLVVARYIALERSNRDRQGNKGEKELGKRIIRTATTATTACRATRLT